MDLNFFYIKGFKSFQSTWLVWMAVLLLANFGCARKNADSSTLSIQIPTAELIQNLKNNKSSKVSSFANAKVAHIAINISGPGMNIPAVYSWDRHNFCSYGATGMSCSTVTSPASVEIEVDSGDSRLVQLLLVVEDADTKALDFLYADQVASFYSATSSVALSPVSIGSSSGAEAKIIGRYFNSAGVGPTGPVAGYFNPPNGKNPMKVVDGYIYGGWTELFVLDGASFTYKVETTGEVLLENATLSQFSNLTNTNLARLHIPNFCRWDGNSTHSYGCDFKNGTTGEDIIFGFFGPGSAGKTAYYLNSVSSISGAYAICTTNSSSVTSCTGNISYSSTAAANSIYPVGNGGVATSSTSTCSVGDFGVNCMMADVSQIAQKGKEGVFGFRGSFASGLYGVISSNQSTIGTPLTLTWTLLTGTYGGPNGIDGVDVFYTNAIMYRDGLRSGNGDGYNCNQLPQLGFTKFNGTVTGILGATQTAILTNAEIANINRSQMTAILCPYSNNFYGKGFQYHPSTAGLFNDYNSSSPSLSSTSSSSSSTSTTVAVAPSYLEIQNMAYNTNTTNIGANSCSGPFTIIRKLGNSTDDYNSNPANVSLSYTNAGSGILAYANSDDCIKELNALNVSSLTIPGGNPSLSLYFKSNNASVSHTITAMAGGYNTGLINLNVASSAAGFVEFGSDTLSPFNHFSSTFNYTFTNGDNNGLSSTLNFPMSSYSLVQYIMVRFTNNISGPSASISNLYATNASDPYFMFAAGFPGGSPSTCASYGSLVSYTSCTAKLEINSNSASVGSFDSRIFVNWTDYYGSQLQYIVRFYGDK